MYKAWSPVYHFYVDEQTRTFNPPSLQEVLAKFPKTHPRILLDANDWDNIIERNKNNPEAQLYAVSSIPHTVLIDGEGTILARGLHGDELQEKIAEAVK